ncbi:hypothetical protein DYB34_012226 [Aphanomyces astaci]|uniref:Uncharacterized protein n=1 Tax=Aphanomyces astaci TaxID=112090 RepID=A0A418BHP8_APHAT|nr:hypothetical protein DYB34_012226 [Aphanomyces astaci]
MLLVPKLRSLGPGIGDLCKTSTVVLTSIYAQYYYSVALDRRWDIVHSLGRARHCLMNSKDKAANYFELTLRDTDWANFTKSWDIAIAQALETSPEDLQWLSHLLPYQLRELVCLRCFFAQRFPAHSPLRLYRYGFYDEFLGTLVLDKSTADIEEMFRILHHLAKHQQFEYLQETMERIMH